MTLIPVLLVPIAFAGGLYVVALMAPSRPAGFAGRVVDLLGGAAAAVIALDVYYLIRLATTDTLDGFDRDTSVSAALVDLLWHGGLLIAAAAVVLLLAQRGEGAQASE